MKPPKFNFLEEKLLTPENNGFAYRVTLFKTNILYFPKDVIQVYELAGKKLKLYGDKEKHAIAWKVVEGNTSLDDLNTARTITVGPEGSATLSIKKLLTKIGVVVDKTRPNIEVRTYDSDTFSEKLYYITL